MSRIFQIKNRLLAYDTVLFDLDGTLYNSDWFYYGAFEQMADWMVKKGLQKEKEVWINCMMGLKAARGNDGRYLIDEALGLLGLEKNLKPDLLGIYRAHDCRYLILEPEEKSVLESLKNAGRIMAVITNGRASLQEKKIQALGVAGYMDAVVILDPCRGDRIKPDPASFYDLEEVYRSGKTVMVGDRFDVDGQFAKNAGIDFIGVGFYGN